MTYRADLQALIRPVGLHEEELKWFMAALLSNLRRSNGWLIDATRDSRSFLSPGGEVMHGWTK